MSITLYEFDIDTAELLNVTRWQTGVSGAEREIVRTYDRHTREVAGVSVKEGDHAQRELEDWKARITAELVAAGA